MKFSKLNPMREKLFKKPGCFLLCLILSVTVNSFGQHHAGHLMSQNYISGVEPQPLLAQAIRLSDALTFLGSSLMEKDVKLLKELQARPYSEETSGHIQAILDPYCLALVDINPEARVKVFRGPATANLVQGGWTSFLVKIHNQAGITARLEVESANSLPVFHIGNFPSPPNASKEHMLTEGEIANRFLEIQLYRGQPLLTNLSGLKLEYAVLQIYSKDAGHREGELAFNIGQGTQDVGFRNAIPVLYTIRPAVKVLMHIKDYDESPAMASFVITDGIERIINDSIKDLKGRDVDYRFTMAQIEYAEGFFPANEFKVPVRLTGIYPLPSRRLAATDEYPDFFFQPQIYRADGEHVFLPAGEYTVRYTRGPEYLPQTMKLVVPSGVDSIEVNFKLRRWVNLNSMGWYSADHHIHAAGCSHYESPEEGVKPLDMWRQIEGEDLNVGSVLTWGPGWYHQKNNFTGKIHPLSSNKNVMRYDVEVSGFPSSHAGHVVLLDLKEDDYPGTSTIEDWPSYTLPVLKWAKSQGGITGYPHSGWGLQPIDEGSSFEFYIGRRNFQLPNYTMPKMDGIGANEYIVSVTQNVVDFYTLGDTPATWELNMWYHTLNCGFRARISGETDYPCVYDERLGMARNYFKPDSALSFEGFIKGIKKGRCYVSDGWSHIIDFSVNGSEMGVNNSELLLNRSQSVNISAKITAYLPAQQDEEGAFIAQKPLDRQPYWDIERARIGLSRRVGVELIVNGESVDTTEIMADGTWQDIRFQYNVRQSSWVALRIFPSSHTNPVFVLVDNKPIHILKSAQWCRAAVDQCWKMKKDNIRPGELTSASNDYDAARRIYDDIIKNSQVE